MKKLFCCITVFFIFVSFNYAETIIMNDGTVYTGNIHHQDDKVVFIVQKEDLVKLNVSDIKEIKQDEESKKKTGSLKIDNDTEEIENIHELILQIGYDFYAEYSHKGKKEETELPKGINFGANYYYYLHNIVGIGCGVTLQNSRELKNLSGKFYFVPMYLSLKVRSVPTEPYKYGYVVGHFGYNMFFPDSDYTSYIDDERGGLYYAIGLGIVYSNVVFELLSSVNTGSAAVRSTRHSFDIEYRKYTFSIGYVF